MAAPPVLASRTTIRATLATSHLIDVPASTATGDRLLVIACIGRNYATNGITWTGSSATEISDTTSTVGNKIGMAIAYRDVAGAPPSTIAIATTNNTRLSAVVYRFGAGSFDPAPPEVATAIDTSDPPSLSPTWGNEEATYGTALGQDADILVGTYPLPDNQTSPATGAGIVNAAACTDALTGPVNPSTWGSTEAGFNTATFAVRGAASGTDATATPAVVAVSVAAPAAGVAVTAGPAVVPAVAVLPASARNVTAGPAVVVAVAALPTASPGESTVVQPAAIQTVTALPAAAEGIGAGSAAVVAAVALPLAAISTGATTTPTTIVAAVSLSRAPIQATVGPAVIAAAVALPTPSTGATTVVQPAVIAATTGLPAAGEAVTAAPITISAPAALPPAATAVSGNVTVQVAAIGIAVTLLLASTPARTSPPPERMPAVAVEARTPVVASETRMLADGNT